MITTTENKLKEFTTSFNNIDNQRIFDNYSELRKNAKEVLDKQSSFPTSKNEYWKYTRVSKIAKSNYTINDSTLELDSSSIEIPNLDCHKIIFQNGFLKKELSNWHIDSSIAVIRSFEELEQDELKSFFDTGLDYKKNIFNTLNSAFFTSGIVIRLKKTIDKPIFIGNQLAGENLIAQPRVIIVSEKNAEGIIINQSFGEKADNILFNPVYQFLCNENSHIDFINIQNEPPGTFNITNCSGVQDKSSTLTTHHYSLKGNWIRNNIDVTVNGENCQTNLFGAYTAKNKQNIDNHTMIDHRVAHCESNELYKGTASDKATVTFNGKVFVRKDAQKINAFQSNNNILLSDKATVNSKPELEIYADDVKCSHGSTTGQLDEDALFYLQSRGLSKQKAKELLVGAFIGEVVEKIKLGEVKSFIKNLYGLN